MRNFTESSFQPLSLSMGRNRSSVIQLYRKKVSDLIPGTVKMVPPWEREFPQKGQIC